MRKEVVSILLIVLLFTSIVLTNLTNKVYGKDDDDEEFPDYDENKCDTSHIMSKCYDWSKFYDDEITEDNVDVYCDNKPDLTNFEQEICDRLYDMLGR